MIEKMIKTCYPHAGWGRMGGVTAGWVFGRAPPGGVGRRRALHCFKLLNYFFYFKQQVIIVNR